MKVVFEFDDCSGCPYRRLSLSHDWECTRQGSKTIRRAKRNPDGSIEGAKITTVFGYETLEEMFESCPLNKLEAESEET